jgi:hypothetical protein
VVGEKGQLVTERGVRTHKGEYLQGEGGGLLGGGGEGPRAGTGGAVDVTGV